MLEIGKWPLNGEQLKDKQSLSCRIFGLVGEIGYGVLRGIAPYVNDSIRLMVFSPDNGIYSLIN